VIEDQLELRRRLHREISWLLAIEDAIDVASGTPVIVDDVRSIGEQAAVGDERPQIVDRGQVMPGRKFDDQFTMKRYQGARRYHQAAIRRARERRDRALNLAGVSHVDWPQLHP